MLKAAIEKIQEMCYKPERFDIDGHHFITDLAGGVAEIKPDLEMVESINTPGSPMSTGLFFLRRLRICARRSISTSRPTTGSSRPSSAALVMSCKGGPGLRRPERKL